jgi:hypothetical protein
MSPRRQLVIIQSLLRQASSLITNCTPKYKKKPPPKKKPMGVAYMAKEEEEDFSNFTKDTWHADSAASTHMGNSDVGMFDYEDINERVTVGNGKTV